ncbi:Golgi-associated plant pathogenesis-related protein 1-like [Bradysia coprophila]|uniref:Golgi-associated plant pathogenesis-related protein 1-like n=1 Tax=Bradysia coprophila TaxID=38358 RepID=UPI00187D7B13|nr:Golgi-associated plant pathogenesis-related protein 1-like [Bradysia coprophila]
MFNRQLKTVTTNTVGGSSSSSSSSSIVTRSFFTTSTTYHSSSNSFQTSKCAENTVRDAIKRIDQLSIAQPSDKVTARKEEHCPYKRITSEELPATKSEKSDTFHLDCLNAHNDYRRRHGVGPLKLSPTLSDFAQNWANTIANKRQLQHSSERKYGENIYWSSGKTINGKDPVDSWYSEIKQYNYKNATFSSGTGHFTQVVWKNSLELGVGVARVGNEVYVVASYYPPGNFGGEFSKNVFPPK